MKITSLEDADLFIEGQQNKGNTCWWDGWKMVFFRAHRGGFRGGGINHNGRWGFATVVDVDDNGFWNIPPRVIV